MLLEGLPLSEIDPVKQLAEQLDACALEDPMTALIKAEDTTPSGALIDAGLYPWVQLDGIAVIASSEEYTSSGSGHDPR